MVYIINGYSTKIKNFNSMNLKINFEIVLL